MEKQAERTGIFAGDNPFVIARDWLAEAVRQEVNDPNAMALSTVDPDGMPNVRMVLLKEIETGAGPEGAPEDTAGAPGTAEGSFVFYTNYGSAKGREIEASGKAAFVLHWKSLRRQIRVRGTVSREDGPIADAYYASRDLRSRLGAWASQQSQPLPSRENLIADVARMTLQKGTSPSRPPYWGGLRITPSEIEFWADGAFRLHDRFRWSRSGPGSAWQIKRLYP